MENNKDLIKYIENNHNKQEGRICIGNYSFTTTKLWADSEEEFVVIYRDDLKQLIDAINKRDSEIAQLKHDAISENKAPTHKEFQKAIDNSGLRGYEFEDSKSENSEDSKCHK